MYLKQKLIPLCFIGLIVSCSNGNLSGSGNSPTPTSIGEKLTIDNSGIIPVTSGHDAQGGFYIHNNSDNVIRNINISASSNKQNYRDILEPQTVKTCSTLNSHSSCYVKLKPTGILASDDGFSVAVNLAYQDDKKQNKHYSQLLNFQHVNTSSIRTGVDFTPSPIITSEGNKNGYVVVYLYAEGKDSEYTIKSINSTKGGLEVVNGNFIGKIIRGGQILPLELKATASKDKNYIDTINVSLQNNILNSVRQTPTTVSASINLEVLAESGVKMAQVQGSINPLIKKSANLESGTLYFYNGGNTAATNVMIDPGVLTIVDKSQCDQIEPNQICTINYKLPHSLRGNETVTANYSDDISRQAMISYSSVSWFESDIQAFYTIEPLTASIVFAKGQSGYQPYQITNVGNATLNFGSIVASKLTGNGAATIKDNTCSNMAIDAGAACTFNLIETDNSATRNTPDVIGSTSIHTSATFINNQAETESEAKVAYLSYHSTYSQGVITSKINPEGIASISADDTDYAVRNITYTNVGTTTIDGITGSISNVIPSYITAISDTCANKGTLDSSESCVVQLKVGPAPQETDAVSNEIVYGLSANVDSKSQKYNTVIPYSVLPNTLSLIVSSLKANGDDTSGTGLTANKPFTYLGSSSQDKSLQITFKNNGTSKLQIKGINFMSLNPEYWQLDQTVQDNSCITTFVPMPSAFAELAPQEECSLNFTHNLGIDPYLLSTASVLSNINVPEFVIVDEDHNNAQYLIVPQTETHDNIVYVNNNQAVIDNSIAIESNGKADATLVVNSNITNATGYSGLSVTGLFQNIVDKENAVKPDSCTITSDDSLQAIKQSCSITPDGDGSASYEVKYPLNWQLIGSGVTVNAYFNLTGLSQNSWAALVNYNPVIEVESMPIPQQ